MKTKIKASAISNLTDARYFAAREVRWLGFCLDPDAPDYIQPHLARAIMEWVEGPLLVGEFGHQSTDHIREVAEAMALKVLQLPHGTPPETFRSLKSYYLIAEIIPADLTDWQGTKEMMDNLRAAAEVFLLDFGKAGIRWSDMASEPAIAEHWKQLIATATVIIAPDEIPDDLIACTSALQPYGISLRGGDEEKPGYKSFDELEIILEAFYQN